MCHTHGANNLKLWCMKEYPTFVKQANPEAQRRTGNPTHPSHASFHLLSTQAPKRGRTKVTLWIPGFHASQEVWGQGKIPYSKNYALSSLSAAVLPIIGVNRPCIIIQTPSRVNAKILPGWHLTSLFTDVIPISLCTAKETQWTNVNLGRHSDIL